MPQEQGFLGNIRQPRVSQSLSFLLTDGDDGKQVNIPVLIRSYVIIAFGQLSIRKNALLKKFVEGNPKTQKNFLDKISESGSQ